MPAGILWMLFAGFVFSLMGACAKAALEEASTFQAVFFRSFVSTLPVLLISLRKGIPLLSSLPLALHTWNPFSAEAVLLLIGSGLFATVAQIAMTKAYRLERAGIVSLYSYSGPVFAYMVGLILFREVPDLQALLGAVLVIVCGCIAGRILPHLST